MALAMHECYYAQSFQPQRQACNGGSPPGNPKLGSMGTALGYTAWGLRGQVNKFWGVVPTN